MRSPRRATVPGSTVDVPLGTRLTVTAVEVEPALAVRLAQCGVRVGGSVTLLTRTAGGGCVLVAGTGRVALDRRTAGAIRLQPSTSDAVPA